jgi:hypothetical protein
VRLYGAGTLAYFPSMAGRVPCRVLAVEEVTSYSVAPYMSPVTWEVLTVRVMAQRPGYSVGEVTSATGNNVIPRVEYVPLPHGRYTSASGWRWQASPPEVIQAVRGAAMADAAARRERAARQQWASGVAFI